MGKLIAVEIAKTQIRVAAITTNSLIAAKKNPQRQQDFDSLSGKYHDLGKVIQDDTLMHTLSEMIKEAAGEAPKDVVGIGIAISAAVDSRSMTAFVTHQAGIRQAPFRATLASLQREYPNANIVLDNRSNLGAWGEFHLGWRTLINPDQQDLFYLTISSGIGAGIIAAGEVIRGVRGRAGEIGHIVIDPLSTVVCDVCNQKGCISALASGTSLVKFVQNHTNEPGLDVILSCATAADGSSPVVDLGYRGTVEVINTARDINARAILQAAKKGSKLALMAEEQMITNLGKLIAMFAYIHDPSLVILSGIATVHSELEVGIDRAAGANIQDYAKGEHELRCSLLEDKAALYGAALVAYPEALDPDHQTDSTGAEGEQSTSVTMFTQNQRVSKPGQDTKPA